MRATLPLFALLATSAHAQAPQVVTDIAPIHGLVSAVMGDVGTPTLLVSPGSSPHDFALRPSQGAALERADAVFWMGHALTPQLEDPIETLAPGALHVSLLASALVALPYREEALFPDHHDDDAHHDDDHAGDDHAGDDADHHDDHQDAGEDHHDDHDDHNHTGTDPHAWMAPTNAKFWLPMIALHLSTLDPENAKTYSDNAAKAVRAIDAASADAAARLAPQSGASYVVFHDAYRYFAADFDVTVAGALSPGDAVRPSAGRIAELQQGLSQIGVRCLFAEPQFDSALAQTFADSLGIPVAVLDPMGTDIPLGREFYPTFITATAQAIATCAP